MCYSNCCLKINYTSALFLLFYVFYVTCALNKPNTREENIQTKTCVFVLFSKVLEKQHTTPLEHSAQIISFMLIKYCSVHVVGSEKKCSNKRWTFTPLIIQVLAQKQHSRSLLATSPSDQGGYYDLQPAYYLISDDVIVSALSMHGML